MYKRQVLIFDEIITGFRWSAGGAQTVYGVTPDLSCWGKAMANGFPLSALAGRRDLMELGGLRTDRDRVFLLSTTYGADTSSLAAFRAVAAVYRDGWPIERMQEVGRRISLAFNAISDDLGIGDYVYATGRPASLMFVTKDGNGAPSQAFRTLFLQEILKRGVLGQSFIPSAAHTDDDIETTVRAAEHALPVYQRALESGSVVGLLHGRPVAPAIRRLALPRRLDD